MFSKSAFFAAIFVFLGFTLRFASAETPPACVLACVNEQTKVGDFTAICKTNVSAVVKCLDRACKKDLSTEALDHYKSTCQTAGINVVIPTASATLSATGTAKATGTSSTAAPSSTSPTNGTTSGNTKIQAPHPTALLPRPNYRVKLKAIYRLLIMCVSNISR
ncbi:hypothetical protein DFH27DRAFT_152593 [Peziza echinospora]|nr:hypothetical protein DFH27DRAFT_152593 [Peziza echinospora]